MSENFITVLPGDSRNASLERTMKGQGRRTGIEWGGMIWSASENPDGTYTFIASRSDNARDQMEGSDYSIGPRDY